MNRHERRKAAALREFDITLNEIDTKFPIQVDGKCDSVVSIHANGAAAREAVEDQFPGVEWASDEMCDRCHPTSTGWLFTHVRVTRLPPHLEEAVPLRFANAESLGFAVASALYRRAWPLQVGWFTGEGADIEINTFSGRPINDGADYALYGDYVQPGVRRESRER